MVEPLPAHWQAFCHRGGISFGHQCRSVLRCRCDDGVIRGYYSEVILDPELPPTHSMYPSHDHQESRENHLQMVVDARVFNDMKSHLSEAEFWQVIEHFYAVGRSKGHITSRRARRLPAGWTPQRHFAAPDDNA